MTHWMCRTCGHYLQEAKPPNQCPSCSQLGTFNDVTCYRPDCGGESRPDPLLIGATLGSFRAPTVPQARPEVTPTVVEIVPPLGEIMTGLSEQQRQKVRKLGRIEEYKPNAIICSGGAESQKVYLVEEGLVSVQSELGEGLRAPISLVSQGEAFGWSALVPPYRLTATVVAVSKTRVLAIERDPLLALMRSNPSLGHTIMENVATIMASRLQNLGLALVGVVRHSRT